MAFQRLFHRAVSARLEVERPTLLHLSGGFDSASIVSVAAGLHPSGSAAAALIETGSWVYARFDARHAASREAVLARSPFPAYEFVCPVESPIPYAREAFRRADGPIGPIEAPLTASQARHMAARGTRILVMGYGGDDLLWDSGRLLDLGASGHYRHLWAESESGLQFLRAAIPPAMRRALRRWAPSAHPARPPWISKDLLMAFEETRAEAPPPGASHLQQDLWAGPVAGPYLRRWIAFVQTLGALDGVEVRLPFLDRRLVELLWAVPAEQRLTGGVPKRFLREAMRDFLPAVYQSRTDRGDPISPYPEDLLSAFWREIVTAGLADLDAAEALLDLGAARTALASGLTGPPNSFAESYSLWRLACVAMWARSMQNDGRSPVGGRPD